MPFQSTRRPFIKDVAQEHVLRHGEWLGQLDLLMNDADAGPAGLDGAGECLRLPLEEDLPGVGLVNAGQHLVSVDLPAPFSPTRPWMVPRSTSMVTLSRAFTPGNSLLMPCKLSI